MIDYKLYIENPLSQELQVSMSLTSPGNGFIDLQLPAWRPGRYEFQHYARNLYAVHATLDGEPVDVRKVSRNTWQVVLPKEGALRVDYRYRCAQLDAGGSWIDDELCYINPINCLLYVHSWKDQPCTLSLEAPHWAADAVHGLDGARDFSFSSYFQLADSPFFLSKKTTTANYRVGDNLFYIHIHGEVSFDLNRFMQHFEAFTSAQVQCMESFPEKEYHFLLLLFPFRHYHGVEHHRSTVITLGPSHELSQPALYDELLSISSHELFHAWNICKIRPAELYPYRLQEENYFRTGFVAEGFTTYLGEYFLRASGFFSEERFLLEIEQWFNRHRSHQGVQRASLSDSSFDLWVDGYTASASDYKVSIYVAGALAAIGLDLAIRKTDPARSILDVLRRLYQEQALRQKGYTEEILQAYIRDLIGEEGLQSFWAHCISGHEVDVYTEKLLVEFGIKVTKEDALYLHERRFGIKLKPGTLEVSKVHRNSPAAQVFMPEDVLLAIDGQPVERAEELEHLLTATDRISLNVRRKGRTLDLALEAGTASYWQTTRVQKNSEASGEQKLRCMQWLKANHS